MGLPVIIQFFWTVIALCGDVGFAMSTCATGASASPAAISLAVECPALAPPQNGMIMTSMVARYRCKPGYRLHYPGLTNHSCTKRTCTPTGNGTWTGSEPVCKKEPVCPVLDQPKNGKVAIKSTGKPGYDLATYDCNDGYILPNWNFNIRKCLNGKWLGKASSCKRCYKARVACIGDHGEGNCKALMYMIKDHFKFCYVVKD